MYVFLIYFHSYWRYLVLFLLLFSIVRAFSGWFGNRAFSSVDNKLSLFATLAVHIQLLAGVILYLLSPIVHNAFGDMGAAMKDAELRFWSVEHSGVMLIAIMLITIGRALSKKAGRDRLKHKKIAIYFVISFLLILISIPWPFSTIPRGWIL